MDAWQCHPPHLPLPSAGKFPTLDRRPPPAQGWAQVALHGVAAERRLATHERLSQLGAREADGRRDVAEAEYAGRVDPSGPPGDGGEGLVHPSTVVFLCLGGTLWLVDPDVCTF